MHDTQRDRRRYGLIVAAVVGLAARVASAQMGSEQPASILVFPKVIVDGQSDTVIQISNATNALRFLHCFYVDAACSETDFTISTTLQQPVHWVASQGRAIDPTDPFDPGQVPALPPGFRGALLCVLQDIAGSPVPGNALTGEATLKNLTTSDVAKYSGLGFTGFDTNNGDATLCLGGGVTDTCPIGAEYDACPAAWRLDHVAYGASDDLVGAGSSVRTNLTMVPCSVNFETQAPAAVTVQFVITNEFEQTWSASTTVSCWADTPLDQISSNFSVGTLGSTYVQTVIQPASDSGPGIMVVAQEFRDSGGASSVTTSAARNVHAEGERSGQDLIVLPSVGP